MTHETELEDPEISAFKNQFLSLMPSRGLVSNETLLRGLGWDGERFGYIRDILVDEGVVRVKRGKVESLQHGAVGTQRGESGAQPGSPRRAERELYGPVVETLRSSWIPENGIREFAICVTASQGRRKTGGKWTRPDITLASSNSYEYVRVRPVELRTFEVKTHGSLDITAVYEALSHRRAAHYTHVLAYVPENERSAVKPIVDRLIIDAQEHGVGLITFADPGNYQTWRVEVRPRRADPNPADVDAFIGDQTDDEFKRKIINWCRRI